MSLAAHSRTPTDIDDGRISKRNFERLASYVYDSYGIKLPPSKMTMVEGRLRRRVRALKFDSLDSYCDSFFDGGSSADEAIHLANVITTNKTDFFREPNHFDFLTATVLPKVFAERSGALRVWSAACSTGAEPYTLAMVIDDFIAGDPGYSYSILATDLSTDVLDVARRGIYAAEMMEPVPAALRRKYVRDAKDRHASLCRVAPALRSRVGFARLNLMDKAYPIGRDMDLIFCRNVLIYFDKATQQAVLQKLLSHLRPGGYLFLGHSESIAGMGLPVHQAANTIFQHR